MRKVAKWIVIVWSLISLIGIVSGLANIAPEMGKTDPTNQYAGAASFVGLGCGLGIWLVFWFAIAGPALLIWAVSGRNPRPAAAAPAAKTCPGCGAYLANDTRFCPRCGQQVG